MSRPLAVFSVGILKSNSFADDGGSPVVGAEISLAHEDVPAARGVGTWLCRGESRGVREAALTSDEPDRERGGATSDKGGAQGGLRRNSCCRGEVAGDPVSSAPNPLSEVMLGFFASVESKASGTLPTRPIEEECVSLGDRRTVLVAEPTS